MGFTTIIYIGNSLGNDLLVEVTNVGREAVELLGRLKRGRLRKDIVIPYFCM